MTPSTHRRRTRLVVVAAVVAVGSGAMTAAFSAAVALLVPTVLGLLVVVGAVRGLIRWPDPSAQRRVLWWALMAFFLHLLFGLVVNNSAYVFSYLGGDASTYHGGALAILRHWTDGFPTPTLPHGKQGFYYVLAGLYWVLGAHPVAGLAFNATLGAVLVPLVSDLTRRLVGRAAAHFAPPLVVLLPGLFLWTSLLLKEAAVVFLVALAAYCAVRIAERMSPGALVGLVAALLLLLTFRSWVALTLAGGLVAGLTLGKRHLLSGVSTGLSTSAIMALMVLALGFGYSGYRVAVSSDLRQANTVRQDLSATGESGFDRNADISTVPRALAYLPRAALNFSLGPFPWQIRGVRQLPALVDILAWWFLLPSLWVGFRSAWRGIGRRTIVLLAPAVLTGIMLSLVVGNFGTVIRERVQLFVLLVPFIALGLSERYGRRVEGTQPAPSAVR